MSMAPPATGHVGAAVHVPWGDATGGAHSPASGPGRADRSGSGHARRSARRQVEGLHRAMISFEPIDDDFVEGVVDGAVEALRADA